jgi:Ca2+-binding EF-hand superfamily protein
MDMKVVFVTIALGAAVVAAPALAQAPGAGAGWAQRDQTRAEVKQRADMLFQMLDANHDGTVTRAEAEQALTQFQASQGGDGGGQGAGRGRMMQRMIEQTFATTPSVTLQQFEAFALARFDAQDLNHDGVVTAAERQQLRDQRAQARSATPAPAQPQQ